MSIAPSPRSDPEASVSADRVYLDYAAATPVHPVVWDQMTPYFIDQYGNPSAIHQEGRLARSAVEESRLKVARTLGIRSPGVFFTSGGTESNNIALLGYLRTLHHMGRAYADMHVLTTAIEHPATLMALAEAVRWGVQVQYVPVTEDGLCTPMAVESCLTPQTVLCSFAHVNSEVGAIQKTRAISRILQSYSRAQDHMSPIRLHIDAAQSPLWLSCRLDSLGADMLSLDAGKCAGPKGVGVLAMQRPDLIRHPVAYGGGQESGLRPGTEAVPLIVGMAASLVRAQNDYKDRSVKVAAVRDSVWQYIAETLPEAVMNGPLESDRVANNINLSLPGYDTEFAATVLDTNGFAVSTKSACSSSDSAASSVVYALTGDSVRARSTLRLTLGESTTIKQIKHCIDILVTHVDTMKPYKDIPSV